jgi:hypothetical protein
MTSDQIQLQLSGTMSGATAGTYTYDSGDGFWWRSDGDYYIQSWGTDTWALVDNLTHAGIANLFAASPAGTYSNGDVFTLAGSNAAVSLQALGTLSGVEITGVAGMCGPGQGLLDIDAAGNLTWTPPGGAAGTPVDVSAGGDFFVYDSTGNAWLAVTVTADYLILSAEAAVDLQDIYDGPIVNSADVTAAEASAGNVASWSVTLTNTSGSDTATGLVTWLDPNVYTGIEISLDGSTWSQPTTQGAGLAIADLGPGASTTIYLQQTVPASSASLASGLVLVNVSWTGPTAGQTAARGLFRIFNDAVYRLYWSNSTPPVAGSTPTATCTAGAFPYTVSGLTSGTWYFSLSYFDGVYDSGFLPVGPAGEGYLTYVYSAGSPLAPPPPAPFELELAETAPGVVTVTAMATDPGNVGDVWYVTATVTPYTYTQPVSSGALAILSYSLPAVSAGTTVDVTVCLKTSGGTASGTLSTSITTATGGPTAPLQAVAAKPTD